jgi:hypothetical protein
MTSPLRRKRKFARRTLGARSLSSEYLFCLVSFLGAHLRAGKNSFDKSFFKKTKTELPSFFCSFVLSFDDPLTQNQVFWRKKKE